AALPLRDALPDWSRVRPGAFSSGGRAVSEPDIPTLARRLAEQNNVDWRALKGSGPSGKVVERDVLDYLARVMAGEEALDPTPEPLPDGMEAWPDQDLRSFQEGLGESASDMREFRNDMAASVEPSL